MSEIARINDKVRMEWLSRSGMSMTVAIDGGSGKPHDQTFVKLHMMSHLTGMGSFATRLPCERGDDDV